MVPLVFAAAARHMAVGCRALVFIPLLHQLSDEWQQREATDCSVLIAKLFLLKHVMGEHSVMLSELLGAIDLGLDDFQVAVPEDNFKLYHVDKQLKDGGFQLLMDRLAESSQWAFVGPKNYGPDSWLLLVEYETGRLRVLYLQSKARGKPEAFNKAGLQAESAKRWHVSEPDSLMLYVTDQHAPKRRRTQLSIPRSMVIVPPFDHEQYYSFCMSFIKASLAKHGSSCKVAEL